MKRKLGYLILIVTLPLLLLGSSSAALNKVKPLLEYLQNRFGDTYRLCNLTAYKQPLSLPPVQKGSPAHPKVHVCLIGDSFSWKISRTAYQSGYFTHSTWRRPIPPIVDSAEWNILLLETTERFGRERFGDITHFLENRKVSEEETLFEKAQKVFSFKAEDNLQSILFFDPLSLALRELKAKINQQWFGRIDENVFISTNQQHLFIKETIDTSLITSSFKYLSDQEVDRMVENANRLQTLAKEMGYDAVYLSIPPSKVSVMDPAYLQMTHNQLIQRFESHPRLAVKIIPVFDWIKEEHYYTGDTHWNKKGIDIWTGLVNDVISQSGDIPETQPL